MKKLKYTVAAFVLLLCMILNSEMFQSYANSFTKDFFYFSVLSTDIKEREKICNLIQKTADNYGAEVFCVYREIYSADKSDVTVYGNKEAVEKLQKRGIKEGSFNSLFSGTTTINFEDFENVASRPAVENYYFTCDDITVNLIRNEVNRKYGASSFHKESGYTLRFAVPLITTVCALFLLILTWFDIQLQKKENFVLMSLGKSQTKIILKNIITDILFFCGLGGAVYLILNKFLYIGYMRSVILAVFAAFIIINSIIYLSIYSFDLKQVLYGANINPQLLSNSYVIKAIITILTVAVLSSNLFLIAENGKYLMQYKPIKENASEYTFISLHRDILSFKNEYEEIFEKEYEKAKNKIIAECFKENKVSLITDTFNDENDLEYLVVTENCSEFIDDILKDTDGEITGDCTILIPKNCKNIKETTENGKRCFFDIFAEGFENASFTALTYGGNHNVSYINRDQSSALDIGFNSAENPVIVLINTEKMTFPESLSPSAICADILGADAMYSLTDSDKAKIDSALNKINQNYGDNSPNLRAEYENVTDALSRNISLYSRIFLINTVISLFMLTLDFIIISVIIKMEFKISATESALKKILGYSLFNRNKKLLQLNLFAALIGIFTVLISVLMLKLTKWYFTIISGGILLIIEYLLIAVFTLKTEKTQVPKILKGGSL